MFGWLKNKTTNKIQKYVTSDRHDMKCVMILWYRLRR